MDQTVDVLRMIFGAVYVLFLPGFTLTFLFFKRGGIDPVERVALAFALSVAVVPLVTFYLNLLGLKISTVSVLLEVLVLIAVTLGIIAIRSKRGRDKRVSNNTSSR